MRKAISLIIAMTLIAVLVMLGTAAYAASEEVTLSAGESLADALAEVADGGTIRVNGTVAVTEDLGIHGKTVTITGGTLDFSDLESVPVGDHITFDDITLNFTEDTTFFANGYKVTMGEGVTMPNAIKIFGGKKNATVVSTDLTLLGGQYNEIYGGAYNGNVISDTHLYVGGNANSGCNTDSHSRLNVIYGGSYLTGGYPGTIGGTAYTVFTDNAKANYLYGGNLGSGTIMGGTDITVSGGVAMAVYGANGSGDYIGDAKLLISGGTMEQVFGGSEGGSVTGDVVLDITGGKITRRVYGGCYNEYDGSWKHSRYVNGQIVLTLHANANISFSSYREDRAIYAHSRHASLSDAEVTHLVYADATAYNNYKNKVMAQDSTMKGIMSGVSAADHIHYHTYTASGAVITQNCTDNACAASATVAVKETPAFNDAAVEPAEVTYSGDWFGGELNVIYKDNTAVGTGTASITCGGAVASAEFEIAAPSMMMNGVGYKDLESALTAARKTSEPDTITLTQDLELSSWVVINTDVVLTADKAVTISAADSQLGAMFRIVGTGSLSVTGASKDAKITLVAGAKTNDVIFNNGGNVVLTNVQLTGNNNKAYGIFNYKGTTTAKNVDIEGMKDGIYVMKDTTVNLDNVTVFDSGRYGIKVKGTLNIANTSDKNHALTVSGSADYAMDVESGGKVVCDLNGVPADTYVINLADKVGMGLHVRRGGEADLPYASEEN